jgi:hypothetical protein
MKGLLLVGKDGKSIQIECAKSCSRMCVYDGTKIMLGKSEQKKKKKKKTKILNPLQGLNSVIHEVKKTKNKNKKME